MQITPYGLSDTGHPVFKIIANIPKDEDKKNLIKSRTEFLRAQAIYKRLQGKWLPILEVYEFKMSCRVIDFAERTARCFRDFADPDALVQEVFQRMLRDHDTRGLRLHYEVTFAC